MKRPAKSEYASFYEGYINRTRGANALHNIEDSASSLIQLLNSIEPSKRDYAYADRKWTLHQMLQHLVDFEVVFNYRCLWIARDGEPILPGYEHNDWADNSLAYLGDWDELIKQFKHLRAYNLSLLRTFDSNIFSKSAQINGVETTLRALAFIIAGHCYHHIEIIKSRYL